MVQVLRQGTTALVLAASLSLCAAVQAQDNASPLDSWQTLIRDKPFWESQGVHANLATIRRWVLSGVSYCEVEDRHIFFDRRATFLGYMDNAQSPEETQQRINMHRARFAEAGRVPGWVSGGSGRSGYPFALACRQPYARLSDALARYTGEDASARLWGTWDGMRLGSADSEISLHEAITQVYQHRVAQGRVSLPEHVLGVLAGKVMIESGGRREAHSAAGARGIMQLSEAALQDCRLDARFHLHRMAQIDCALYLLEQNHRNLEPVFLEHFGDLPTAKRDALYRLLLIQAYHGGAGRVAALMTDPELNGPARYFMAHHERFTPGDIALGMVFHNLGRNQLGFASLYYVTDVSIALETACRRVSDLACQ